MPPAGHCSASLSGGITKHCYSYSPCALDHEYDHERVPNVAMKH